MPRQLRNALGEAHVDRDGLRALPGMPALDREALKRAGLLREASEVTPVYLTSEAHPGVLRLDDAGRREAARAARSREIGLSPEIENREPARRRAPRGKAV